MLVEGGDIGLVAGNPVERFGKNDIERAALGIAHQFLSTWPEYRAGTGNASVLIDAAEELARRTLTNLYNERPAWLVDAHNKLDDAVAKAYGWPTDISDEDVIERLLALNLKRAAVQPPRNSNSKAQQRTSA